MAYNLSTGVLELNGIGKSRAEKLEKLGEGRYILGVSSKEISKMTGQKKENLTKLREKGYDVSEKIYTVEQGYNELKRLFEGSVTG